MAGKLTVIIDGDVRGLDKAEKDAERILKRLESARKKIADPAAQFKQFNNLNDRQMRQLQDISKHRQRIIEVSAKSEAKLAQETAKQVTNAKKSELKIFENTEKTKLRLAEQSARARTQAENNSFRATEAQKRREFSEYQRIEREKTRIAKSEAAKRNFGGSLQTTGQGLQSAGTSLTAAITLPLATLATLGVKSALEIDKVRTKLIALEGDAVKANKKLQELQDLAADSVGVTQEGAFQTYTQLKGLGGIADDTINKVIKSLGKLNAAFNIEDQAGFIQNLNQIFTQGFERSDIKEAIGKIPFFEQLLESAFGTKDGAKLKALKESGKLTLDTFLTGMSDAIDADPRIANIGESLSLKIFKGFERLNTSLAPLGDVILRTVVPAFEQLSPYIAKAAEYFSNLSPGVQTAIVAIGALVAGLGPALVALGALVAAIGAIASAISTVGIPAILAIGAAITGLIAIGAGLLAAWQTNFGGIRDVTANVSAEIQKLWNSAMAEISNYTKEITAQIAAFWKENGADIEKAVSTVLDNLAQFWKENGETIKSIVSGAWEYIKTVVTAGTSVILNTIKLVSAVINGDWAKAWEATKAIVKSALNANLAATNAFGKVFIGAVKVIFNGVWALQGWVASKAYELGKNLVQGLVNGLKSSANDAISSARSMVSGVISIMQAIPKVQSPSKVTTEIGENIGEGLALGIESKFGRVSAASQKLAKESLKALQNAVAEFQGFVGLSPDGQAQIAGTEKYNQAVSNLKEIIKLRDELGINKDQPLPATLGGVSAELKYLQEQKKAAEDALLSFEDLEKSTKDWQTAIEKANAEYDNVLENIRLSSAAEISALQEDIELLGITDDVEKQRIQNAYELISLREKLKNDGFGEAQIDEAVKIREAEQGRIIDLVKQRQQKQQAIDKAKEEGELLKRQTEEARREFEYLRNDISDSLAGVLIDFARGGLKEGLRSLKDVALRFFDDFLSNIFRRITDNIANNLLSGIFGGNQSSSGGGFLSNIFGGLFGGGGNLGTGTGNPNILNFGGGGIQSTSDVTRTITLPNGQTVTAGGGSIFGKGGIFGSKGFGFNGGTVGGIGALAALAGGAIGGRFGSILSGAGTGASIGAMFGGPIGGLIGAGVGALFGIFGGDPKRKQDKKENLPALRSGFADALQQLRDLARDTRSLRVEPESAIAKATELRQQIASGFGINFLSKKYRKQSQSEIQSKLVEADALIKEIREAADIAGAANERRRRILPEFADGGAVSRLFSGLVPGAYDRKDDKLIKVSGNEVVLTPDQWRPITPYLQSRKVKGFADGGFVGSNGAGFSANFEVKLVDVTVNPNSRMEITNKETQRKEFVSLYKDAKKNREI